MAKRRDYPAPRKKRDRDPKTAGGFDADGALHSDGLRTRTALETITRPVRQCVACSHESEVPGLLGYGVKCAVVQLKAAGVLRRRARSLVRVLKTNDDLTVSTVRAQAFRDDLNLRILEVEDSLDRRPERTAES
jgi:hypothetical protein